MHHQTIKGIIDIIIGAALFTVDVSSYTSRFNTVELLNQYGFKFPFVLKGIRFILLVLAVFLFLVMNKKYIVKSGDVLISILIFFALFMAYHIMSNLPFSIIYYWTDSIAILLSFLVYTLVSKKQS